MALAFGDSAIERAYRDHHATATRVLHRASTATALIGWCAIGGIDAQIGGSERNTHVLSLLRYGAVTPAIALTLGWHLFAPPALYRRTHEWVMGLGAVAMMIGIAVMISSVPEPALHQTDQALAGFMIILVGTATLTGQRFAPTMIAIGVGIAGFLTAVALHYPESFVVATVWLGVTALAAGVGAYLLESLRRQAWDASRQLARERERSEALLHNLLPEAVAERLKQEPGRIAEAHDAATVLFADLVRFTSLAARIPAAELVALLDAIFTRFDELAARLGLEKIKTIGDSYMVVGGVPTPRDDHATAIAELALGMHAVIATWPAVDGEPLAVRIGVHTGPVVAGVIGSRKLAYDVWGDTVNLASRMESHGVEGQIQVSESTYALLRDTYELTPRGTVAVKGKGEVRTWLLVGPRCAPTARL